MRIGNFVHKVHGKIKKHMDQHSGGSMSPRPAPADDGRAGPGRPASAPARQTGPATSKPASASVPTFQRSASDEAPQGDPRRPAPLQMDDASGTDDSDDDRGGAHTYKPPPLGAPLRSCLKRTASMPMSPSSSRNAPQQSSPSRRSSDPQSPTNRNQSASSPRSADRVRSGRSPPSSSASPRFSESASSTGDKRVRAARPKVQFGESDGSIKADVIP